MSGMGGGWFDAMGGGWFDAMGGGWMDSSGGGGVHGFAMRADRPMAEHKLKKINIGEASPPFHPRYWDGDLLALAYLPTFFTFRDGNGKTWDQVIDVPKPPAVVESGPPGSDSIDELLTMAVTERPEAMGEILNQHQNQQLCFLQLLMINHNSHPATYFAMKLVARVGEVVMMHFKRIHKRARPSQVCPTLYPPVAVPGHASYPAGHAAIATLTAACLKEITKGPDDDRSRSSFDEALDLLARNIGRNRVIAGLHYVSDISAGAQLGDDTYAFLRQIEGYKKAIEAAQLEWAPPREPS